MKSVDKVCGYQFELTRQGYWHETWLSKREKQFKVYSSSLTQHLLAIHLGLLDREDHHAPWKNIHYTVTCPGLIVRDTYHVHVDMKYMYM